MACYKPTNESFDYTELVEDSVKDYANRYPARFNMDDMPDVKLTGDKVLIQMAVNNLLENAVKYTPADKVITISMTEKNGFAVLDVADEGPGVPEHEKAKIFNKFNRIGNEETRKAKGTGLGLYLTSKIVKQHKGRISVKDNQPGGAIFEICLPLA